MHKLVILWVPGVFSNFLPALGPCYAVLFWLLIIFFYNYNRSNLSANYQKGNFLLSTKNITHELCTKCIYTFLGKSLLHPCFFPFVIWLDRNTAWMTEDHVLESSRMVIKNVKSAVFYVTYSASLFWKVKSNSQTVNTWHRHDIFMGVCLR